MSRDLPLKLRRLLLPLSFAFITIHLIDQVSLYIRYSLTKFV